MVGPRPRVLLTLPLLITTKQITGFTKSGKNDMLLEPGVLSSSPIPYYKQYQNRRDARFWRWVRNTSKATQELSHVRKIRRQITDMNKINVDRSSEIMQLTWTILAINVNDIAVRYSAVSWRNFYEIWYGNESYKYPKFCNESFISVR